MKRYLPLLLLPLLLLLLCRFLYPHTRFGYCKKFILPSQKRLNTAQAALKPGEQLQLKIKGPVKAARYSSSDFRIASVTPSGKVHAISEGTAIIYVKQGPKTYKCKVTVAP